MSTIGCDISEFQPVVDDSYPRRWLTFRVSNEFGRVDQHAAATLAWCLSAVKRGRLDGFAGYVNAEYVSIGTHLANLDSVGFPKDWPVMIDAEPWPQRDGSRLIVGDHSSGFNAAATALAQRQGDRELVWGYSYLPAYAEIWPNRPSWLGLGVASYTKTPPVSPGPGPLIFWQYTDGATNPSGQPSVSAPFGACDHNAYYRLPTEDQVTPQDIAAIAAEVVKEMLGAPLRYGVGTVQNALEDTRIISRRAEAEMLAQFAAQAAAFKAAASGTTDMAAVQQAAQQGAEAALSQYQLTLTKDGAPA